MDVVVTMMHLVRYSRTPQASRDWTGSVPGQIERWGGEEEIEVVLVLPFIRSTMPHETTLMIDLRLLSRQRWSVNGLHRLVSLRHEAPSLLLFPLRQGSTMSAPLPSHPLLTSTPATVFCPDRFIVDVFILRPALQACIHAMLPLIPG